MQGKNSKENPNMKHRPCSRANNILIRTNFENVYE